MAATGLRPSRGDVNWTADAHAPMQPARLERINGTSYFNTVRVEL
jgi:hypothetical protein